MDNNQNINRSSVFNVELDNYQGDFELFYNLVKEKKIDLATFSLIVIINQYLKYVSEHLETHKIDDFTDYLLICSAILELRSKLLLPGLETLERINAEIETDRFIQNLLVYKQYQQITPLIKEKIDLRARMFERLETKEESQIDYLDQSDIASLPSELELSEIIAIAKKMYLGLVEKKKIKSKIHEIQVNEVAIEEVHESILEFLKTVEPNEKISFEKFFLSIDESVFSIQYFVVCFVCFLVLVRNGVINLIQDETNLNLYLVKI